MANSKKTIFQQHKCTDLVVYTNINMKILQMYCTYSLCTVKNFTSIFQIKSGMYLNTFYFSPQRSFHDSLLAFTSTVHVRLSSIHFIQLTFNFCMIIAQCTVVCAGKCTVPGPYPPCRKTGASGSSPKLGRSNCE